AGVALIGQAPIDPSLDVASRFPYCRSSAGEADMLQAPALLKKLGGSRLVDRNGALRGGKVVASRDFGAKRKSRSLIGESIRKIDVFAPPAMRKKPPDFPHQSSPQDHHVRGNGVALEGLSDPSCIDHFYRRQ